MNAFSYFVKRWTARGLALLLTWAVLLVVVDRLALPYYTRHFEERKVPDFAGRQLYEGTIAAKVAGFQVVRERTRPDANHLPETIVDQRPAARTLAKPGRTVFVTVAASAAQVRVPNLFELSPREAALKLEASGLVLDPSEPTFEVSDLAHPGFIARQEPSVGVPVKPGTIVRIILSKGTDDSKAIIPDVSTLTFDIATRHLKDAGFVMLDPSYERSSSVAEGHIIRQTPAAGTALALGGGVEVVISSGQ